MSDHDPIHDVVIRGLDPVMEQTPEPPDWDSLQFEKPTNTTGAGRWWIAAAAAAVVFLVGAGLFFVAGSTGTDSGETAADPAVVGEEPSLSSHSIAGVWLLESYGEGPGIVLVEPESSSGAPWIQFHETFAGSRETFAAADAQGTAGTFTGDTGCNKINHGFDVGYEFSTGFLVLEEAIVEAGGCNSPVEEVMLTMLWKTPDGIEVVIGGDAMTWHGSNLHGLTPPLTFRRAGAPPNPHPDDPPPVAVGRTAKVFNIDGLEVVTVTETTDPNGQLPNRAEKVEFTTTVIDSGAGPELCTGGVADSLPPQCSGPIADGLDLTGWTEEAGGVRWGERTVVVTWPPIDGHVQLVEDSEPRYEGVVYPPGELPDECGGIERFVGPGAVNEYALGLGDRNGDVYLTNEGVIVLQVVGDPQEHRDALASDNEEACVIEVDRNAAEQRAILDSLGSNLADLVGSYGASTGPAGRVEVYVAVADAQTAEAIANLVEDRTSLRIIGHGVLLP